MTTEVVSVDSLYDLIEQLVSEREVLDWNKIADGDGLQNALLHKNCELFWQLIRCADLEHCTPKVRSEMERIESALLMLYPFICNNIRASKFSLAGKRGGAYIAEFNGLYQDIVNAGRSIISEQHPYMVPLYGVERA